MGDLRWLRVEVGDGMFPHERAVSFLAADGSNVSLFVPDDRLEGSTGRLRVRLLDWNQTIGLVELPASNMSGSGNVVRVDMANLES